MIQETSRESYLEIKNHLGDKQEEILNAIKYLGKATDTEIAKFLGYEDINKCRPRRYELVEKGIVGNHGVRLCSITGKNAIVWGIGKLNKEETTLNVLSSSAFNKLLSNLSKCNDFQKRKIKEVLGWNLEA